MASGANDLREERGALPVVIGGDFEGYWASGGAQVAKAGMRAGLFHPLTGYSLPDAVKAADAVAALQGMAATMATVVRDGQSRRVPAAEVVPGGPVRGTMQEGP